MSSSRKLLINQDASQSSTVAGLLQISGTTNAHTSLTRFTANSSPPSINMNKSRGTSHAVPGAVANGDKLGNISWRADDGTTFIEAARIAAFVDGAPGTNDMPGALSFYTTADGAAAVTERMRIDRNGLITGTGTSLGDWTSYTPAITNLTLGNGTVVGKYAQIGKIVHVRLLITLGSTSSVSGTYIGVDLPITQAGGYSTGVYPIGVASLFDASASDVWQGPILSGGVAAFRIYVSGSSGSYLQRTDISSSVPFTWAASDTITASLTYQAA